MACGHIELTSIRYAGLTQLVRELYWQVHCQFQLKETKTVQHVKKISNSPDFYSQAVHGKSCSVIRKRHASQCPLQKYPRAVEKAGFSEDTTKSYGEHGIGDTHPGNRTRPNQGTFPTPSMLGPVDTC